MSISLESIKKESIKLKFPNTTTAIGFNSNTDELLIDIGEFTTTINFDVELEESEQVTHRDELLEYAYDNYCYSCIHNIYGPKFKEEYLNNNFLTQLVTSIVLLEDLNITISKMVNIEKVNKSLTEEEKYLIKRVNDFIQFFILDIFPTNLIGDFCRKSGVNSIVTAIKYESFNIIDRGINESAPLLESGLYTLKKLNNTLLEVSESNTQKIYINDSTDKNFYLFKQLDNLKLEKVFKKSTRYSFTIKDIIEFLVNNCNHLLTIIENNHNTLLNSIKKLERCSGINNIGYIEECVKYCKEGTDNAPTSLVEAFYTSEDEEYTYRDYLDRLKLKIPSHYYQFNLVDYKVHIYRDIEMNSSKDSLKRYTFQFPNIDSTGLVCFDENRDDVILYILNGSFSTIIELFWSSYFNHDLAHNNGFNSTYDAYTYEYHEELIELLHTVYNCNDPAGTLTTKGNSDYSFTLLNEWRWYDINTYDFYIKRNDLGSIDLLIVVNKNTDTFEIISI